MSHPSRAKVILILGAIAIGAAYYNYHLYITHGRPGGPPQGGPPVSVATVLAKDVQEWHPFSGKLVAVDQVAVRPQVSGVIEAVRFQDGADVHKDDPLFTIDPRPYAAEVEKAEGALASAQAQESLRQTELARAENLIKDKTISQREYDERKNNFNVAQANVKSATAALDAAKLNLSYTEVKAPITGKTGRPEITVGNLVTAGPNAPVLTTIVYTNEIYADFDMDENTYLHYMDILKEAASDADQIPVMLDIKSQKDEPPTGHVLSFDNRLNPTSGTIRVRAVFDNSDDTLVPGMYVHVRLGSPTTTHAILITDRAVGTDLHKKFVLVVGEDNKVIYREVKLGSLIGNLRIVQDGLKPGEKIIVNGLQRARPGQQITPETVSMDGEKIPAPSADRPS